MNLTKYSKGIAYQNLVSCLSKHRVPRSILNMQSHLVLIYILEQCDYNRYGANCSQECYCADNQPCDKESGLCASSCADGYHGEKCDLGIILICLVYLFESVFILLLLAQFKMSSYSYCSFCIRVSKYFPMIYVSIKVLEHGQTWLLYFGSVKPNHEVKRSCKWRVQNCIGILESRQSYTLKCYQKRINI